MLILNKHLGGALYKRDFFEFFIQKNSALYLFELKTIVMI